MADPVDTRLRAARPPAADLDPDAFDGELLARLKRQPTRSRRPIRIAAPAAALAIAGTAAVLVVSGGPAAPPSAEAAVRQAQQWFDPPAGTILHVRSEMTSYRPGGGSDTLVQETWQSVDDPSDQRYLQSANGLPSEYVGADLYDAQRDTIYEDVPDGPSQKAAIRESLRLKLEAAEAEGATDAELARMRAEMAEYLRSGGQQEVEGEPTPLGDPTVVKVRVLLRKGKVELGPEETHAGVPALPILIRDGQPRWTLWTAAEDGRPLELRIDSGPGTDPLQTTRWTDYEVVPFDDALLSLDLSHPGAQVVRDADAYDAATARLFPNG